MPRYLGIALPPLIGLTIGHFLACASTVVRLVHRARRRQIWWDDAWAGVALFFTLFSLAVWYTITFNTKMLSRSATSFLAWANFFTQPAVIWASRLSIQATVIRFLPPGRNRTVSRHAFGALAFMWVATTVSKVFYCGYPIPLYPVHPYCYFEVSVTVISVVLNCLATIWLIGWPAYVLLKMNLSKPHRRLFIVCFSSAWVLLAIVIWQGFNVIKYDIRIQISGHLEIMVSLVTCNLLVLATYIYRILRNSDEEDSDDSSESASSKGEDTTSGNPDRTTREMSQFETTIGPLTTVHTSGDEFSCGYSSLNGYSDTSSSQRDIRTFPTTTHDTCVSSDTQRTRP
ncbi:hypothetical protein CC1G_09286 [Coprinopsis cinerea okayama7|uniref:Integral membrane protein n=1 Tax=Coprinopsis cinerea (strain Okayama-7 / 130 / ATCC MYA-4618 / FGSC 9003) TaxID=240176 RepID=A8N865_COPC7|nr:hypothetical protein CC1G_09286 [Coprinopsis cinerea okayama7\|eukprot:XP_001831021.2 hypothetical protein CC1G_09286 [Coprinopsis cinerea okayama7\